MTKGGGDDAGPRSIPIVVVPRAVADRYYGLPWRDVVAAAKAGSDGLLLSEDTAIFRPESDTAHLREHDGRAFLFKQGWMVPNPFSYWPPQ